MQGQRGVDINYLRDLTFPVAAQAVGESDSHVVSYPGELTSNQYKRPDGGQMSDHESLVALHGRADALRGRAQRAVAFSQQLRGSTDLIGDIVRSRRIIEQAKGILMQQHCDADAAFRMLVTASQRSNIKIRDIAQSIVTECSKPLAMPTPATMPRRR